MNMAPIADYTLVVRLLTKLANTYYIVLLGETGSGKSTLLNMFVNFFRGPPQVKSALPEAKDLRVAVPTAHIAVTEPEGAAHSERNAADRKCLPDDLNLPRSNGDTSPNACHDRSWSCTQALLLDQAFLLDLLYCHATPSSDSDCHAQQGRKSCLKMQASTLF